VSPPHRVLGLAVAGFASMMLAGAAGAQSAGSAGAAVKSATARAAKGAASHAAATPAAAADPVATYGPRFASICAACHGANGRGDVAGIPVLAGQHGFYAITQLFLFREGRRANEAMTAVAKTLTDDDMRGFSAVIDALPPVPAPAPSIASDEQRMAKGRELAREHKCVFCHGEDLSGGQQVPRIGGQHEDYLRDALRGFKSGSRPGYTQAMIGAVSQVPLEDLDLLAYYAAHLGPPLR
jgi:cytochrome c553